jgi:hypothetical protein
MFQLGVDASTSSTTVDSVWLGELHCCRSCWALVSVFVSVCVGAQKIRLPRLPLCLCFYSIILLHAKRTLVERAPEE